MYVGSRRDVDAATFATVTNPSHVRFDLSVTGPKLFDVVAPYARAANLFDATTRRCGLPDARTSRVLRPRGRVLDNQSTMGMRWNP
jgi:uncharacterized protein YbjT (DUF2867 family)